MYIALMKSFFSPIILQSHYPQLIHLLTFRCSLLIIYFALSLLCYHIIKMYSSSLLSAESDIQQQFPS